MYYSTLIWQIYHSAHKVISSKIFCFFPQNICKWMKIIDTVIEIVSPPTQRPLENVLLVDIS